MTPNAASSSESRFKEEGDWIAHQFFSAADLQMSPEEHAARHAHLVSCFALQLYRYRDPTLGAWVRRLGEILTTGGEVERCQQRFLTAEELVAIRKQAAEGF